MNNFLKFYGDNAISPVSQNINDYGLHRHRRVGLYRTLGLPAMFFQGKDVLEVAPGSGHNSIVTATFGMRTYDLIEPNATGFNALKKLFQEKELNSSAINFFNCRLEDFREKRQYDIVLCEGLLPGLDGGEDFFEQLQRYARPGGILVVTCLDNVSVFFETVRRYLTRVASAGIADFSDLTTEEKCKRLAPYFQSHLASLKGMTRSPEDWVYDTLLNPAASSVWKNQFSIEKCLKLSDDFWFYGDSPRFLKHMGWYKNIEATPKQYNETIIKSYYASLHNLLHYKEESALADAESNFELNSLCEDFTSRVDAINIVSPGDFTKERIQEDTAPVSKILQLLAKGDLQKSHRAITEFLSILSKGSQFTAADLAACPELAAAWGRGQQYVAIVKDNRELM